MTRSMGLRRLLLSAGPYRMAAAGGRLAAAESGAVAGGAGNFPAGQFIAVGQINMESTNNS